MLVTDLLQELGVPYLPEGEHHPHSRAGWVQIDCPWCGLQGHWRYGINIAGMYGNCWACGKHPVVKTLLEASGASWAKLRPLLRQIDRDTPYIKQEKEVGVLKVPKGLGSLLMPHLKYLHNRGFDPEVLHRLWGLRGIGLSARLSWRLFIPVHYGGLMRSWTTRSIGDQADFKYINARPEEESAPIKDLLLGLDYCRHAVIVVEGPFDVFAIGPGAACTFGTNYTKAQLAKIAPFPVRVVCYDSEPTAQRQARRLCGELSAMPGDTFNVELRAKDPGEAGRKEIRALRREFLGERR